jgi:hypothetical protein
VAIFPPNTKNLAGSNLALVSTRATGSSSALKLRNSTPVGDSYLIQVSARRGWGAYRLRWTTTPGQ